MGVGVERSNATVTNVVLQINVALTGFSSNGPVHVNTKDLITALSGAVSGGTTNPTFAANAKLVVISDVGSTNNNGPSFFVREKHGTTTTDTAVSAFLSASQFGNQITFPATPGNVKYSQLEFDATIGDAVDFYVEGFSTQHKGAVSGGHGVGRLAEKQTVGVTITGAAGSGTWAGNEVVLRGSVTASAPKVETD